MSAEGDTCLFGPCNASGALQTFKTVAVQKIIATSKVKKDELYKTMSGSDILAHKSCYCSYTSKSRNIELAKRKSTLIDHGVPKRLLKSQCSDFVFKRDCLLCGEECKPKDSKNPHSWVQVRQCTTVDRPGNITFQQQLENICEDRQDQWANEVAVRLCGVFDLHASDAQYHVCCYDKFRVIPLSRPSMMTASLEEALRSVVTTMTEHMKETWTTTELYSMYVDASGTVARRQFVSNLKSYFGDKLIVLHIEGCESVVGFKDSVGQFIKIAKKTSNDDDELEKMVRKIGSEIRATPKPGNYNLSDFVRHKVIENTSATLLKLVSCLVSGGDITKQSLTLAQCIQQHVCNAGRNQTTLGLAVKLHHKYGSSELITILHEHGITATYDEVLRFRKSAAKFVFDNQSDYHKKLGLSTEIGPIFSWADNYDLYIASPNGMKSTHAMVMEFTQHPAGIINTGSIGVMQLTIPRIKKHEMSSVRYTHQSIQLDHYTGSSKVNPPLLPTKALSAEESQLQSASVMSSQQRDAAWLSQVHGNDKPVEWAGFNAQQDRLVAGSAQKPKTLVVFGPMIDSPPAHPDTVLTTLVYLEKTLNSFGMQYTHLTVDLQLYQTACLVQWNDPVRWNRVILHPGMMHTLMSFLGCIGKLMKGSGVDVLISAAFAGITSIVNGKAWTNALRAYRLIIAVSLENFFSNGAKTYEELSAYLESVREHPTGKLWVDCLVKPTLLSLMFLRAERNGDFLLEQHCLKEMLPYYFAAGHQNYARYLSWYVRQMENLPQCAKEDLLAGAHVCRHSDGGTAVPADQFGEQTYIKRGKGSGCMKGISTSPEQVAVWVNSFSVCAHLDIAMEHMYDESEEEQRNEEEKGRHKEEGEKRRSLDEADRKKIKEELEKYIHPFNYQEPGLYNICNGQVAADTVNVQNALAIGSEQSIHFSDSLSSEFHKTIKKNVKTMESLQKAVTIKGKAVYDIETLFSRLLTVGQQRHIDIADVLQFEMSPVPPALIDEYGCLRKGDKAVLVKSLGVLVKTESAPDVVLVDGGQILYHVVWPVSGTTGDLAASFGAKLAHYPPASQKIILFDKYDQEAPSAKDHERIRRGKAKEVRLTANTPLPCREAILHNSKNKNLLINILCGYKLPHNIQLVGQQDCVVTHAEADITLCSYMLKAVEDGAETIRILSDDTDVFVLLVYWTSRMQVSAKIEMEKWKGNILDINETVRRLGPRKCSQLLGVHALSGCDTVSYPFGKGKLSALKVLETDMPALDQVLGQPSIARVQLQKTACCFFLSLYCQKSCTTMNDARVHFYRSRKKPPKLNKLPPTDANLELHVLRAHLQMLRWKAADQRDPPLEAGNIANFGWNIEGSTITPAVSTAPVAPQALLDVVSCSCTADGKACSGTRCSCSSAGLSCTDYCKCEGGDICCSPFTIKHMDIEDDEEEQPDVDTD